MSGEVAVSVRHYVSGGRENGGGIGRLVGYVVDARAARGRHDRICDTRGPRVRPLSSTIRLLSALGAMAIDRLAAPGRVHHIHVAGRGSTLRKLILCAAARALGCAHVLHLHDYDYAEDFRRRPAWLRRETRRMFRGADRVVALGRRDRAIVCDLLGVEAGRVAVFNNCVPDPGPRRRDRAAEPVILFLGRLSARKGVPELLAALAAPEMASLPWRAVLAGDGPVEAYRAEADALGLGARVAFTGWLDEAATAALRRQADILALPSHAEGLAMAVLEGLADGLAVVTTPVGAHEEVVTHGENGLFTPVGDPAALAATLATLIRDPAARERLGGNGRALYLARFSMAGYVGRLDAFYRALSDHPDALREAEGLAP
jgi:glycosyltransferase involved in cell wall biosynthesis